MYTNVAVLLLVASPALGQEQQQLSEGATCWVGKKNGTCVNLFKCPLAANYYTFRNAGHLLGIRNLEEPQVCSFRADGEPVVCCTDCSLDNTERLKEVVVMEYGMEYEKRGPKAWKKCQEYFRDLPYPCHGVSAELSFIRNDEQQCDELRRSSFGVGVDFAQRGQYPHTAFLGFGEDHEYAVWLCGGSVISERYILTSAHCVSGPVIGNVSFAALGIMTLGEINFWKVYKIKRIIRHPEYNPPHKYHDIALVETDTEINFGKEVLPACLDVGKVRKKSSSAPGWGHFKRRFELAEYLTVMELNEYNSTQCSKLFPNGYNSTTQMCFGQQDKIVDRCEGDSGSPLQVHVLGCLNYVVGVRSFGKECGLHGNAGLYTRVQHYVPWIESIVWPDT